MLESFSLIPVARIIVGNLMIVAVVGIVFWHQTRQRELQMHQGMRIREMDHQRKIIERAKLRQTQEKLVTLAENA